MCTCTSRTSGVFFMIEVLRGSGPERVARALLLRGRLCLGCLGVCNDFSCRSLSKMHTSRDPELVLEPSRTSSERILLPILQERRGDERTSAPSAAAEASKRSCKARVLLSSNFRAKKTWRTYGARVSTCGGSDDSEKPKEW